MTDDSEHLTWGKRNRIWLIPVVLLAIICGTGISLLSGTSGIARAYTDEVLFQQAVIKASDNQEVLQLLGPVEPPGKMAIAEGNVSYDADGTSLTATIGIKGAKGKAKLDFSALKEGGSWAFTSIQVRLKSSDKSIKVLP